MEKPYEFRNLDATDLFSISRLVKKIGINNFRHLMDRDWSVFKNTKSMNAMQIGIDVVLGVADVVFDRLPECENEIYELLSRTSNLTTDEVKALEMDVFFEMVVDFIKKDEFVAFSKAVMKLFE